MHELNSDGFEQLDPISSETLLQLQQLISDPIIEFVLKQGTAFWWHPAGDKLVYASYDNHNVDMMPVVVYGPNLEHVSLASDEDDVTSFAYDSGEYERGGSYPRVVNYPYPKPLKRNSQVSLHLIFGLRDDPTMRKTVPIKPPIDLRSS